MLPTPSTSHVPFDKVYEPAEDSFLFLDTLSRFSETSFLNQRLSSQHGSRAPLVVEVGTGSGVILSFIASNAATLLGRRDALLMGTDINIFACKATVETIRTNISQAPAANCVDSSAFLECVNGNLTAPLARHSVDLLVFNPPYVPSETVPVQMTTGAELSPRRTTVFEQDSQLLALATDGGAEGMEITNKLLSDLPRVLHPQRGVAYVLLCAQNRPDAVKQRIRDWGPDWSVEIAGTSGRQGGWERLQIIRIARVTP